MAVFSRTELCKEFGIKQAYLSVNIKRGNLVLDEDGKIDTSDPKNALFVEKRKAERGRDGVFVEKKQKKQVDSDSKEAEAMSLLDLKKRKDLVAILKTEEDIELAKLKKEKLQGESVPVDSIKSVLLYLSEAIHVSWEQELESFLLKLGAKYSIPRDESVKIRTEFTTMSNAARKKAVDRAKKDLKKIQVENSAKREVGEHD